MLRGDPGAGKSDLALRCIGSCENNPLVSAAAVLIADDRVMLTRRNGELVASAPPSIKGRLEVRGVGIVDVPTVDEAVLRLVVDLVSPGEVARLPDEALVVEISGVSVPLFAVAPFEASASIKVLLALRNTLKGD